MRKFSLKGRCINPAGLRVKRRNRIVSAISIAVGLLLVGATSASAVSPQFVGLNWDGQQGTLESSSNWDAIQHSGTKLFRVQGFWKIVSEKGNWKENSAWEQSYDKYFQFAAERDITLLPYLYGRKTGVAEQQFYLSSEWGEWLEFVWTFVQRYGRGGTFWAAHPSLAPHPVTTWEVWNESNLVNNNPGGASVLPQKYAEFLVATSKTITEAQNVVRKAGEPFDTKILVGGLYEQAGVTTWTAQKYFGEIAKNTTLNNEFKSRNSGYGLHPYSFPNNEAARLQGMKETVTSSRNYLSTYDSAAKPIWITELGWAVQGEGLGEGEPQSTAGEQANLLTNSFNWLKEQSTTKNIEYVAWYNYRDFNSNPKWAYHCGLRTMSGAYRPAWFAYIAQTGAPVWPQKTVAFQANSGDLWTLSPEGQGTHYGMALGAGTSPAIARLVNGTEEIAFQANTHRLWTYSPSVGPTEFGLELAAGTSPGIGGLSNGSYEIAFQANTHRLWTYSPSVGPTEFGLELAAGTSPSVSSLGGSYEIAFQANTHRLWTYAPATGAKEFGLELAAGTSPSITELSNGSYLIAFQANTGELWTLTPSGAKNYGLGMAAGTSPSVAPQPGAGWVVGFQANTGQFWTLTPSGATNHGFAMATGSSPAVGELPNGTYEAAFHAPTGDLWTYAPAGGAIHYGLGLAAGTSPAVAR